MVWFPERLPVFFTIVMGILATNAIAEVTTTYSSENVDEYPFPEEYELDLDEFDDTVYQTVVKGRRFELSAGTRSFSQNELDRAHVATTDDVMKLVAGVHLSQHGALGKGHQIHLRGFDAAHGSDVEVLLQGIPINEPSHVHGQGYLDLYGIIPEVVCEFSVHKGPFLPWQGNFATAGSFRFFLCLPAEFRPGVFRTEVSHHGKLRGVVVGAPLNSRDGTFVAAEAVYDHGFGPDRQARRAVLMASYERKVRSDGVLSFLLSGQSARFETPGAMRLAHVEEGRFGFYGTYGEVGEGISDRLLGRVGYRHDRDDTDLELFLYGMLRQFYLEENFTGWLMHPAEGDRKSQEQSGPSAGAQMVLEQKLPLPFTTELFAGLGWRLDNFLQKEKQRYPNGEPWKTGRTLEASLHQVSVYSGLRFSPLSWIIFAPSVRLDLTHYDVRNRLEDRKTGQTLFIPSPRVALSLPVHKALTLFADYGRGFRMPEARAVDAGHRLAEDEKLSEYKGGKPSISSCDAFELGLSLEPIETLNFRAMWFGTFLEHEIVFDHVSNVTLELDGTRRWGLEAEVSYRLFSWMSASADFTFINARFKKSGNPVPGVPSWLAKAAVIVGKERGPAGGLRFTVIGKRHLAHGASIGAYSMLNVNFGWRFEHFEVVAIVENLLNQEVPLGAYHYASWFDKTEPPSSIPQIHYTAGAPFTFRAQFTAFLTRNLTSR